MLKSLYIKNFTLIESLELEFDMGLNIITGETGAGKSIIIDALMLSLGERGSSDYVRQGEKKAVVEGIFEFNENPPVFSILEKHDYDHESNEIIIRREINAKGTSRCFINDSPVQVSLLKNIGDLLVDFHGQHDHQLLLKKETHSEILDSVGDYDELIKTYNKQYEEIKDLKKKLKDTRRRGREMREKEDLLRMQLSEIDNVNPEPGEDDKLESELKILENAEFLVSTTHEIYSELYEGDNPVHDKLTQAGKLIDKLTEIDDSFDEYKKEIESSLISADEVAKFVKDYASNVEFDPQKIEEKRERQRDLRNLSKKYGTIDNILKKREQIINDLNLIDNFEDEIENLVKEIDQKQISLGSTAFELSDKRQKTAENFNRTIENVLKELGIQNALFKVKFDNEKFKKEEIDNNSGEIYALNENTAFTAFENGIDIIEFLISTNRGETPKPLVSVASGGEISRVMLGIKSILAESETLPMLVFDEIDIGISGRIAQKVGITMRKLAQKHQIIAITHLPQIAALGDLNISVSKYEDDSKTIITAENLDQDSKLVEIAKLLGGSEVTEATMKIARELADTP